MALALVIAGADGVMREVHPEPDSALSGAGQSIALQSFKGVYQTIKKLWKFKRNNL